MEQDGASRIGRDRGKCSIMNTYTPSASHKPASRATPGHQATLLSHEVIQPVHVTLSSDTTFQTTRKGSLHRRDRLRGRTPLTSGEGTGPLQSREKHELLCNSPQ